MPDLPQNDRAEMEAKVTALVLGELPANEAAVVRLAMEQDVALRAWHDQLRSTLGFVREGVAAPEEQTSVQPAPLKLSEARRERLLAHFKTVRPEEFKRRKIDYARWITWAGTVAAVVIITAMMLPSLSRTKTIGGHDDSKDLAARAETVEAVERAAREMRTLAEKLGDRLPESNEPGRVITQQAGQGLNQQVAMAPEQRPAAEETDSRRRRGFGGENFYRAPAFGGGAGGGGVEDKSAATVSGENRGSGLAVRMQSAASQQSGDAAKSFGVRRETELDKSKAPPPAVGMSLSPLEAGTHAESATTTDVESLNAVGYINVNSGAIGVQGGTAPAFESNGEIRTANSVAPSGAFPARSEFQSNLGRVENNAASVTRNAAGSEQLAEVPVKYALASDIRANLRELAENAQTPQVPPPPAATPAAPAAPTGATVGAVSTVTTGYIALDRLDQKETPLGLAGKIEKDLPLAKKKEPAVVQQSEILTRDNPFSTFSLNVSDASFRLAAAGLDQGQMPEAGSIRSEDFVNAFDYRDPEPGPAAPVAFAYERATYPFEHNRDLLRFSIKTAALGREEGRPLNIVVLLDKSGSMERADRVEITRQVLATLAVQLHEQDVVSVVVFARTARLWADGVAGTNVAALAKKLGDITPEGGTNLEEAMRLAYETALRHYQANGENRVVLLTDGAANLGNVEPEALKQRVETNRKQGIAFDCFGIGWEGYNDDMLETLSRTGGGRYGFINTPEEAGTEFAGALAGALRVAAYDVKTQVEFNPNRVSAYRQIGYAKHQLTKEQFRDNGVKAAQLGAAESGNALYVAEVNPSGQGPIATVRVRFRLPGSGDFQEREWTVPYLGAATPLENSSAAMRLAATACAFSEWLSGSPHAGEITTDRLLSGMAGVSDSFGADPRPRKLEAMIREAKSISGK